MTRAQIEKDGNHIAPKKSKRYTARTHTLVTQLSEDIIRRIRDGHLDVGDRLPSVRQYAQQCGVSNETVLRVYDKLVALGYLKARRGAGFFVISQRSEQEDRSSAISGNLDLIRVRQQLFFRENTQTNIGSGLLPESWMNHDSVAQALQKINPDYLHRPAEPRGFEPFRQQLQAKLLQQGILAQPSQIITTSGATDALHLVIWANFYPGDYVIAESPGPFVQTDRLMASGLEIARVPRHADGPDLDAFQAACERYKPKAFFCSSVLQNPTSTSISLYKAHQILKIAEAFKMIIIDDDTYGDLLPQGASGNVARLAALDQLERVIHIGSFSKTISSSLRSGFLAANPKQIERILMYRIAGTIHNPALTDLFMYNFLAQENYQQHCLTLQKNLDMHRNSLCDTLNSMGCQVQIPRFGMYLWANIGDKVDTKQFVQRMASNGILTVPGQVFSFNQADASYMRFNIALADMHKEALKMFSEELQQVKY
ncbi:TPA: PLP-dependent aminotransferase family protein [Klebsiella michiganensis]|nr:PLP-dependent aminotransferase family protein [Enterobacter hormaechei subsp. steigerwaltii]HAV1583983.1 PLP-dependent aminotransferase family protein [Enterobacter hormaechei subsp. steigerwaltii]HAV1867113.1 PLP-dependent aminotransferase family protein [Enterobacter hormaechei subsp. steigerwaltii]